MHRRTFIKAIAASSIIGMAYGRSLSAQPLNEGWPAPSPVFRRGQKVSTGFWHLDTMTGKLYRGDLIVLGARPGMGNTVLAMNMAERVAVDLGMSVAVFSMRTSAGQYTESLLKSRAGIPSEHPLSMELPDVRQALEDLARSSLFLADDAHTADDISSFAMALQRVHGQLDLIIVDYLQLLAGIDDDPQYDSTLRVLKQLARCLNVPVVILSTLRRSLESRQDKRPLLDDISYTAIERYADMVMFLYRDEHYNENADLKNIAEIAIASHRHGPCDKAMLAFIDSPPRFYDEMPLV